MAENNLVRTEVMWSNIHTGTGLKLLSGMVLELDKSLFGTLSKSVKMVEKNKIYALAKVDGKVALTHQIVTVGGKESIVSI